jgi:CDP-diacylglycerol--glycerol-3-phosphate 3-phosphatidyltransferase
MNLPNKITLIRIFLVPIFLVFIIPIPQWIVDLSFLAPLNLQMISINEFISKYGSYVGAAFFILAASTDGVDGYIARKTKQVTKLGIFLDPIADKLLITAALIALVENKTISSWAAIIIIGRELIVTGLRLVAAGEGVVISAGNWGKIKMIVQIVAISAALLKNYPISIFTNIAFDGFAMFVAVIITVYSGYDYIKRNIVVLKNE